MRILVLGGTSFVGRAIVEDALNQGADVTLFNRGKTGTDLFPGLEWRIGDRDSGDYTSLRDGEWDAVVDVSGYVPRHVGQSMDALGDRVGRYLFISTNAVYVREGQEPGLDESAPRRAPIRDAVELTEETYGPSKAACEDDVMARYGDRATIVRPCKVAGPYDNQNGLTYWVRRTARGGRVALPGYPEQPVQLVDSRDLARLVVQLIADDRPGTFNAMGPAEPTTLAELIQICARAATTEIELVPVRPDAVASFFPLVRPRAIWSAFYRSSALARSAGMPATPLAKTAADVLVWDRERGQPPLEVELSAEDEARLIAEHRA